jgi:hypothetical protein
MQQHMKMLRKRFYLLSLSCVLLSIGVLGLQQHVPTAHAATSIPTFDLVLSTSANTVWGHNEFAGTELDNNQIGLTNNGSLTSGSFGSISYVFARGNNIFEERNFQFLFLLAPGSCTTATGWCLTELDNNTATVTATAGGNSQFYQTHNDGTVWQLTGNCFHCWTQIDSPDSNRITAGAGKLFEQRFDGTVWKYSGTPFNWIQIDNNPTVAMLKVSTTGVLYEIRATEDSGGHLTSSGVFQGLSAFNWKGIYSGDTSLIIVSSRAYQETINPKTAVFTGTLLYNGNVNAPSWSLIDTTANFQGLQPGTSSDALYRVLSDDSVWQYTPESGVWTEFSPPVAPQAVALAFPDNG